MRSITRLLSREGIRQLVLNPHCESSHNHTGLCSLRVAEENEAGLHTMPGRTAEGAHRVPLDPNPKAPKIQDDEAGRERAKDPLPLIMQSEDKLIRKGQPGIEVPAP